ncbi:hypothetical protein JCM8547_002876 [Rhodosporidiobolus lusitaniae]
MPSFLNDWLYRQETSQDYNNLPSESFDLDPPPSCSSSHATSYASRLDSSSNVTSRLVLLAFLAGAVLACFPWAVLLATRERRVVERLQREREWSAAKEDLFGDLSLRVDSSAGQERRYGPPQRGKRRRKGFSVSGPAELLTPQAPALSLYDGLRDDLRYLMMDSWSGETGQVLTTFSLLYLAQQTQRVAIIASPWRDDTHYPGSRVSFADIYDLERFREETGTLFVMLDQVKKHDPYGLSTVRDEVACFHGNNFMFSGNTFGDFHFSLSNWQLPRLGTGNSWAEDSVEAFLLFDADAPHRFEQTQLVADKKWWTSMPRNLKDSRLICYDNLWGLARASTMSAEADPRARAYIKFDGLQRESGGMYDLLEPSMRGKHPEWYAAGQHLDFKPEIWDVALYAVRKTLGVAEIPEELITVHLRRGDFETWCSRGKDCVPQVDAYRAKVDELLQNLPADTPVLASTDSTSPTFISSLRSLGWFVIDHSALHTSTLLKARYGELSAGWFDAAVDQAIHSLGSAFVGTADSQVSLIGALRVATWNGGETRIVDRP